MRLLRCLLLLLLWSVALSCSSEGLPTIERVSVASIEQGDAPSELPKRVVLTLDIDNPSYAAKLLKGRVRISYEGRNVVILSLDEKVKVAARSRQQVDVPLHVGFARNSSAVAIKEALRNRDLTNVKLEWQLDVRVAGIKRSQIVQAAEPMAEILSEEQLQKLWQMLETEPNEAK